MAASRQTSGGLRVPGSTDSQCTSHLLDLVEGCGSVREYCGWVALDGGSSNGGSSTEPCSLSVSQSISFKAKEGEREMIRLKDESR